MSESGYELWVTSKKNQEPEHRKNYSPKMQSLIGECLKNWHRSEENK